MECFLLWGRLKWSCQKLAGNTEKEVTLRGLERQAKHVHLFGEHTPLLHVTHPCLSWKNFFHTFDSSLIVFQAKSLHRNIELSDYVVTTVSVKMNNQKMKRKNLKTTMNWDKFHLCYYLKSADMNPIEIECFLVNRIQGLRNNFGFDASLQFRKQFQSDIRVAARHEQRWYFFRNYLLTKNRRTIA